MFQLLATRIIDDVIEEEMRRRDHVDSDVITEERRSASDAGLTSWQIQQLTDAHNARRRSVGATNMELMVYTHTHNVMRHMKIKAIKSHSQPLQLSNSCRELSSHSHVLGTSSAF